MSRSPYLRVSRYSTNEYGLTFRDWCEMAGVKLSGPYCRELSFVGRHEREAWKNGEDPSDWFQANRKIEEAKRMGEEADMSQSPEPPWHGKDLFTRRRRRAYLEGFHSTLWSRKMDGTAARRPCAYTSCGDSRCKKRWEEIRMTLVEEIMER